MAQRILGLDLGATAVKAVLLESAYRGFTVLDTGSVPLARPAEGVDATSTAAAVKTLLLERNFKFDTAIVAYPGVGVSTLSLSLPFSDERQIKEAVGFEVEGQIPFDLADVAWDWQLVGSLLGAQANLLVALVKKAELKHLLDALAEAGVDPRAIVPAATVLSNLLVAGAVDPGPEPAGTDLFLDVGHERTSLCVATASALETARTFPFGGSQLVRALARELSVKVDEASAILAASCRGEAAASEPRVAEVVRKGLQPLLREVRATLRAYRSRAGAKPLRRTFLAGGPGRLPLLAELLSAEVEGPVAPLEFVGPAARLSEAGDPYALALALALRGHLGSRAPRLNLRRGEFSYTRDFERVRGKVGRLVIGAGLLVLLALVSTGVKAVALARQESALDHALCDAQEKVLGKCYEDFGQAQAVLRGHGTLGANLPRMTAVEIFTELSNRVPDAVPLRFEKMEIGLDSLHLQGTTDAAENVDRIVAALQQSRCFTDARSGGARRRGQDQKFEFSIDSGLTCLEAEGKSPRKER